MIFYNLHISRGKSKQIRWEKALCTLSLYEHGICVRRCMYLSSLSACVQMIAITNIQYNMQWTV